MQNKIKLFEDKKIRIAWDQDKQDWYFSVVDVISALMKKITKHRASTGINLIKD